MTQYLSADEATARLNISKATLYAYVSRGLIRSEEGLNTSRARRYHLDDVVALQERKAQRRNPARAAERALDFGPPVLESSITLIESGTLYYRGEPAQLLARERSFEEVASWLWLETFDTSRVFGSTRPLPLSVDGDGPGEVHLPDPLNQFQSFLPAAAEADLAGYNLSAEAVAQTGARVLELLVRCIAGESDGQIAARLSKTWYRGSHDLVPVLNAALIVSADHELNISAFTARCIASAGSSPYLAVNGALCALRGHRHGGSTQLVAALYREAEQSPITAVASRLKRGENLPGFGHRLYPDGDPRARLLLSLLRESGCGREEMELAAKLIEVAYEATGLKPNIDFLLVLVARVFELPESAPLLLFAIGRTAGWIGQISEQYQHDSLIRPRARYLGPPPRTSPASE